MFAPSLLLYNIVNINPESHPRHNFYLRIFRLQKEEQRGNSREASPAAPSSPPALNLSYRSEDDKHDDISDKSESELADIEDEDAEMDDNISEDNSIEAAVNSNGNGFAKKLVENGNGKEIGRAHV